MDCDDVTLLLADHVATCDVCAALSTDTTGASSFRWIVRVPEDALDDEAFLALPTVDPIVFTPGHEIARGGMGRICLAHDRRLGREVAIKEAIAPGMRARFEREVAITARLQHPAIVPVYEAGAWPDGTAFYTMRLVAGGTLHDAIKKATTREARLALLPHVIAATDALAYAHSKRIVHRDVKPGNILVGEFGETLVIDWGLATELGVDPPETSVVGTPGFMSPEQLAGDVVDERTDVFALGTILAAIIGDEGPEDLRAIVKHATELLRDDRFASAKDLADELRRFTSGQLLRTRDYRVRDLLARWVARHRAIVIVGAIALLVVAVVGIWAIAGISRSRDRADAMVATLLEEQGRTSMFGGGRDRGLVFLSAAFSAGRDNDDLRYLLAEATRDLDLFDGNVDRAAVPASPGPTATHGALVATAEPNGIVHLGPMTTGDHHGAVRALQFSPDGAILVGAGDDKYAYVWDALSLELLASAPVASPPATIAWTPDGAHFIVADGASARRYRRPVGHRISRVVGDDPMPAQTEIVAGGAVAKRDRDGTATVVVRGKLTLTVDASTAIGLSPDGKYFASGYEDGGILVWGTASGNLLEIIHDERAPVRALAWSADGTRLASHADGHTNTWDVHRDTRSPAEIAALAATTKWILVDGSITARR